VIFGTRSGEIMDAVISQCSGRTRPKPSNTLAELPTDSNAGPLLSSGQLHRASVVVGTGGLQQQGAGVVVWAGRTLTTFAGLGDLVTISAGPAAGFLGSFRNFQAAGDLPART
jgi:hypothetical protein